MKVIFDSPNKRLFVWLFYLVVAGVILYIFALPYVKRMMQADATYPFTLPQLPYAYNALEPHIDTLTMEFHHDKHHKKYVDELNAAIKDHPELHKKTLEELLTHLDTLPESIRTAVRDNGGGHYNHSFFWTIMSAQGGGEPTGRLKELIDKYFKDFASFKEQFTAAAKKVFGSGWAWLTIDKKGDLHISTTANQDSPISEGLSPLLGLDVWEHAYYLKYQNRRPEYIDAWWHVVNWPAVQSYLDKAQASQRPPK